MNWASTRRRMSWINVNEGYFECLFHNSQPSSFHTGLEICKSHRLDDPVEFVEKWMAYSISNLEGAEPTVQFLLEMENREYKHQNTKSQAIKSSSSSSKRSAKETSNLRVYNQRDDDDDDMDEEENELLGSYVCITPKVSE
jgi:hypothetical protein